MIEILFTKDISADVLSHLNPNIKASVYNFLPIEILPFSDFENAIDWHTNHYLISSQNAVKSIENLDLKGEFYVVGQKTAQLVREKNFQVKIEFDYAEDLANYIIQNLTPQKWNFFCGNHRRDTLIEILSQNQHQINEIIVYHSTPNPIQLPQNNWDGICFLSPLGVNSYFQNNVIQTKTRIFAIGKTTAEELKKFTNQKIILPTIPTIESLIETINKKFLC